MSVSGNRIKAAPLLFALKTNTKESIVVLLIKYCTTSISNTDLDGTAAVHFIVKQQMKEALSEREYEYLEAL